VGFSRGKVLDAGWGVGNWSIALACFFDEVHSVENDHERLRIVEGMASHFKGRIITRLASIEQLPFDDQSFDAVFCNGVIFVCNYRKALAEFARVLKPDAPLYVSYDGKAWWRPLIHERGKSDAVCIVYGANGLISLLFRLMDELGFEARVEPTVRERFTGELINTFGSGSGSTPREQISDAHARYLAAAADDLSRHRLESTVLVGVRDALKDVCANPLLARKAADALLCLDELTSNPVPASYRTRVAADLLARFVLARSCYRLEIHTYSHEPEEMTEELMRHGFHTVQSAFEGCLCLDTDAPPVNPVHDRRRCVFETVALAPNAAMRGVPAARR